MKTEICDVCGELLDELDFYTVWDSVCKVCDEIHPTHRLGHAPRKRRKGSPETQNSSGGPICSDVTTAYWGVI